MPADPDRLEVADWSAGWRRIIGLRLGSEEESCDRLAMPALGLGGGNSVHSQYSYVLAPGPDTGEAADVKQEDQSKTGGKEEFQMSHENAQWQRRGVQGGGSGAVREILGCFSTITLSFQSFDICGRVGGVRKALKLLCTSQVSQLHVVLAKIIGTRSQVPGTDLIRLLPVRLQQGSTAVFASLPSPPANRTTESGPLGSSAQKLVTSVPSARLSSGSL